MREDGAWPYLTGEMAERVRAYDWSQTPIGPLCSWPQSLRATVGLLLASPCPMILLWGPELIQIYNDGYRDIMGAKHPGGLGQPNRECWGEVWDFTRPIYDGVVQRGESFTFEDQRLVLERHGYPEETFFTLAYSPVPDENGEVGGVLATVVETTEKVRARAAQEVGERRLEEAGRELAQNQALRESEARFRLMADAVPQIVWITDADGRAEFFNRQWARYTGSATDPSTAEEAAAHFVHPDDAEATMQAFREAQRCCSTFEVEHRIRSARGDYRWFLVRGEPYVDPDTGRICRWFGASTDIHDLKMAEHALRQSESKYRTLFESMDEGFCILQLLFDDQDNPLDYRFLEVNPAFEHQTGLTNAVGLTTREIGPSVEPFWIQTYGRVALTGEAARFQRCWEAQGLWFDVYAFRLGDPKERRVALLFDDISDSKRAEAALEEAARRKDEFLATLAHELRNPLAPILNAIAVLRMRPDDPAAVERNHETIRRQVDHMRRLIDDLLDVARITRGMVELQPEIVDIGEVLSEAAQMARPLMEQREQELNVAPTAPHTYVRGDPHRLVQVVTNLLTNAAKFTPRFGQITLSAGCERGEAVIRVGDSGKGIPPEMLPHIFDLFTQVNPSIDRAEGGLGLGLTLVQKLVEMHGGRVEAFSAGPSRGSEFTVRLPGCTAPPLEKEAPAPGPSGTAFRPLDVLAVDDNMDAAETLAELLSLWGHEVRAAYSGPEALQMVRQRRPDVVLLDIGLPGMDGYEVARKLREDPRLASACLFALTGFGQEEDRQRTRDAGFDGHLTKPVDPEQLRRILDGLEQRYPGGVEAVEQTRFE